MATCERCQGTGAEADTEDYNWLTPVTPCTRCNGRGTIWRPVKQAGFSDRDFFSFIIVIVVCSMLVGGLLAKVVPWLWDTLKPIIHAATGG